jgi:hypothetical protein
LGPAPLPLAWHLDIRADQQEFCQRLSEKGDTYLKAKLSEWENFYNCNRSHGAFNGKTPYKALRERL